MADIKADDDDKIIPPNRTAESNRTGQSYPRGPALEGSERGNAAAHLANEKTRDTDQTLRLDGEEDTLYEDGLDLKDRSRTLTGIDGQDDSNPER